MIRSNAAQLLAACAVAFGVVVAPRVAGAEPTVWARARDPEGARRSTLLADAETLLLKHRALMRHRLDFSTASLMGDFYLAEARRLLESAGAATSKDASLRHRLAEVLFEMREYDKATPLYEAVVASRLPAVVRGRAYNELAICYARLGRHEDEIHAYSEALALEPHAGPRATLLANRAEAYMVKGDLDAAIEGYRGALALLGQGQMARYGATTLWGLAVALDRSGDFERAFESIQLARTYDPLDRQLDSDSWFYVPDYDEHWYKALGHWHAARRAELGAVRVEAYAQAIAAWQAYIDAADANDKWLPLAKLRRKLCEQERDRLAHGPGKGAAKTTPNPPAVKPQTPL